LVKFQFSVLGSTFGKDIVDFGEVDIEVGTTDKLPLEFLVLNAVLSINILRSLGLPLQAIAQNS